MLSKRAKPRYIAIAETVLQDIQNSRYAVGAPLPAERSLAKDYRVSTMVVNQALNLLAREGVIEKVRGRGNFVRASALRNTPSTDAASLVITGGPFPRTMQERRNDFLQHLQQAFPDLNLSLQTADYKTPFSMPGGDILILNEHLFAELREREMLEPLPAEDLHVNLDQLHARAIARCRANNRLFGLPLTCNPAMIFYNREILSRAGQAGTPDIATWRKFTSCCQTIRKRLPRVTPLGFFNVSGCWWENIFFSHGLRILDPDARTTDIFSRKGLGCLHLMRRLVNTGLARDMSIVRDAIEVFNRNGIAFTMGGVGFRALFAQPEKWGCLPIPANSAQTCAANSFVVAVRKGCENRDTAMTVAGHLVSGTFQTWLAQERSIVPANRLAVDAAYGNSVNLGLLPRITENCRMLPLTTGIREIYRVMDNSIRRHVTGQSPVTRIRDEITDILYAGAREEIAGRLAG